MSVKDILEKSKRAKLLRENAEAREVADLVITETVAPALSSLDKEMRKSVSMLRDDIRAAQDDVKDSIKTKSVYDEEPVTMAADGDSVGIEVSFKVPHEKVFKGERGEKGDRGEAGEKGKDGTDGRDGKDGVDGVNGKDGRDGEDGKDGRNGKDGKDGSPDTADQIADKLNTLEERVDVKVIKGLDNRLNIINKNAKQIKGGGTLDLYDEGTLQRRDIRSINFVGSGVTAAVSDRDATVTIGAAGTDLTGLGVDNRIARWDGTDTIQSSGVTLDDSDNATGFQSISVTNTTDAASNRVVLLEGNRATPANNDEIYVSWNLSDSAGNQDEMARFTVRATDVTTTQEDAEFRLDLMLGGTLTNKFVFTGTGQFQLDEAAGNSEGIIWRDTSSNTIASLQAYDAAGTSQVFWTVNRVFTGSAWSLLDDTGESWSLRLLEGDGLTLFRAPSGSTTFDNRFIINNEDVRILQGLRLNRTASAAGNYTTLAQDLIIAKTGITGGGDTVNVLSAATAGAGKVYIIKDESGTAGTNNITVDPAGSQTIDGATTQVINADYGSLTIYSDGSNWFIV